MTAPWTPEVTLVVATYQRRELVAACVEAMLDQRDVDHEVVVVDNGSTDGTEEVLAEMVADDHSGRLRVERIEDNQGPARARNLGWQLAHAPLVAFTDDDCRPTPDWAAALVAAARTADVVQGRTLPRPDAPPSTYWSRSQTVEGWTHRFETCNLLVRRDLLARVGGFDERFPIAMGEDTELGFRLLDAGARTSYTAAALIHHEVWNRDFRTYLRERRRWAAVVELVAVEPRARAGLEHQWVWRRSHPVVLAALPAGAVALLAGHWWLPALGAVGWSVRHAGANRHRGRPPTLLLRGLQDLAGLVWETLAFTAASIRHRTLLL